MINLKKFLIFCFIFLIVAGWIFSGWPQIWQNPRIPPEIKQAQAATVTLLPNAAGTDNNWTYVGGSLDYTNLQTDDGDTTYAQSPTANNVDHTVNLDDTILAGAITSVNACVVGRAPTATEDHEVKVYVGASSYISGTEFGPTATYAAYCWLMTASPATGLAWTWTEINGLQVGVETDTNANTLNYTQFYAVVDYTAATLNLTLDSSTKGFGTITPGTPTATTTVATVTTDNATGYSLRISDGVAGSDSALLHTDTTTRITDYAGTIATPTTWTGTGLGICVWAADTSKEAKWGTGITETDSNNNYAGIPQTDTEIHNVGSTVTNDNTSIGYKLDVPSTQKSGSYSGNVTITAIMN